MFSVVIISLSLKWSIFLIVKAVSAQCLTVGNQNSTVKETAYSHSTQRPQLTPSIWTFTVSVPYCVPFKKCTPTVTLKSMICSQFTAFFAASSSYPCFIVRVVGWRLTLFTGLHSCCAVTAWGEKWLEDDVGDWLGWMGRGESGAGEKWEQVPGYHSW